ncbi:MAG: cytochrome B [Hyphomicrobiales bacterium]|nr:MAG: cytochrome B [Hyphomicrobiales bacterium]
MKNGESHKSEVWDIYIRIFHWLLTFFVLTSFISIKYFDSLTVHFISGYCIVGLLVFRLVWGLFGSETARFKNFVKGPLAIVDYLKSLKNTPEHIASYGHSPIAAVSIMAMLFILIAQVFSGLFYYDEEIFLEGPLARYGSDFLLDNASYYHPIGANLVMLIIAVHLLAIAIYYIFFKQNLITPMIVGWRKSAEKKTLKVKHIGAFLCILSAFGVVAFVLFFSG